MYDISGADISDFDGEKLFKLAGQLLECSNANFECRRVVLVSEKNLNPGTAQLFKEYFNDGSSKLPVFDSLAKAEEWIVNQACPFNLDPQPLTDNSAQL